MFSATAAKRSSTEVAIILLILIIGFFLFACPADAIGRSSIDGSIDNHSRGAELTNCDLAGSSPDPSSATPAPGERGYTAGPPSTGDVEMGASPTNTADGSIVFGIARSVASNGLPTKATPTTPNSLIRSPRPLSAFAAPSLADTDEQSEASDRDVVVDGLSAHLKRGESVGRAGFVAAGGGEILYRVL